MFVNLLLLDTTAQAYAPNISLRFLVTVKSGVPLRATVQYCHTILQYRSAECSSKLQADMSRYYRYRYSYKFYDNFEDMLSALECKQENSLSMVKEIIGRVLQSL